LRGWGFLRFLENITLVYLGVAQNAYGMVVKYGSNFSRKVWKVNFLKISIIEELFEHLFRKKNKKK
jgi:hypothetical protein